MRRRPSFALSFSLLATALGIPGSSDAAPGSVIYQAVSLLPPASGGGAGVMEGDLVTGPGGAAAVHVEPDGAFFRLVFRRLDTSGAITVTRPIGSSAQTYYEPSLCFDGANYAVAVSTITQAQFLVVSPAGDPVVGPVAIPGIPAGGRTAAFRVRCTPAGYAVFGLVLEPTVPGASTFYTHLYYWLLNAAGGATTGGDLGVLLAPIAYPGFEGAEKEYYDVAFTGAGFFLAYSAECGAPPVFQTCYRLTDLAGNTTRAEAPATSPTTTGPHLASNGRVVGLTTLRQNAFPNGNSLYARFFDLDGTPRGAAFEYDDPAEFPLGFAPAIFTYGQRFFGVYVYSDPITLEYPLKLQPFDADGASSGPIVTVTDPLNLFRADLNIGVELKLVGDGRRIFGKGENSPDFIRIRPMLYLLRPEFDGDGVPDPTDVCPLVADPGQADTGGIGAGSAADGIGDACQCGDVNGDGRVTAADSVLITRSLLTPPTASLAKPEQCDVGGPPPLGAASDCTLTDAVIVRRALLAPPTAGVQQVCAPGS